MSAQHTPGPWIIGDENNSHAQVCIGATDMTADMSRESSYTGQMVMSREEMLANARLIAAAPDLLEALDKVWPFLQEDDGHGANAPAYQSAINAARAAIAKAKGGNQ